MSLCAAMMFSARFDQLHHHHHHHPNNHHHRDGRNNKADRSRHLWQPWVERPTGGNFDDHSRSLSLRCSAMEGTVGTVGKWKRERRHRAVCTSPVSPQPSPHFRHSQEPLDMTTTAGNNGGGAGSRALPPKERASVIMASPVIVTAAGHRASSTTTGGMSDPVIDEHFRRSLGKDYMNVFAPTVAQRDQEQLQQSQQQQQQQQQQQTTTAEPDEDSSGLSVDDHFAKALGDTWVKLQKEEYQKKKKESSTAVLPADGGRQKVNVYVA